MAKYAPIPAASLGWLMSALAAYAVPQWRAQRVAALARARERLPHARVEGVDWYWPATESPASRRRETDESVRLLAPFDPIVWDRRRFELFWGWAYRFEAYTPAARRIRGYYALPLLWRDQVIGWANVGLRDGALVADPGYVTGRPPDEPAFRLALEEELQRMATFLRQPGSVAAG